MGKKIKVERSLLWHRLARILKWIPTLFISVLFISFAIFQIPKIQTRILNEITELISKNTSFNLSIGHANLTWYDEFLLQDVRLYQKSNDSTLIHVNKLSIDIGLIQYLMNREISGDELILNVPSIHLIKPNDSTNMNLNLFVNELKAIFSNTKEKKKSKITIDNIIIENGLFSYNNMGQDSILSRKDYHHFQYDQLNGKIGAFTFLDDSIGLKINSFSAKDPTTPLDIDALNGNFFFTPYTLGLTSFDLKTKRSHITDSLVLHYRNVDQLKYLLDSVSFDISLKKSVIHHSDVALFLARNEKFNTPITMSGRFHGRFDKFEVGQLDLGFGNSSVKGNGYFIGLPVIDETFVDFKFKRTTLDPNDLDGFISENILGKLKKLNHIDLNGIFTGYTTNFVTNGSLLSKLGFVKSDINFKIDKTKSAQYEGKILLSDFSISEVFEGIENIQKITMNGQIKGKGMKVSNANFDLKAKIEAVQFSDFTLSNLTTNGHFEKQFLNADFKIQDPKLRFNGAVELDIRDDQNRFQINAIVDTLDLYQLKLSKDPFLISSKVDINMKGLQFDGMKGFMTLENNHIRYKQKSLNIDAISLVSSLIQGKREINLVTDDMSVNLVGQFNNKALLKGFTYIYNEMILNLENDSLNLQEYYLEKANADLNPINADLKIKLKNINPYIQPFYPTLSISKNVEIESHFSLDSITVLSFYTHIDSIKYQDHCLASSTVDLNISKNYYNKDVLASLSLASLNQAWVNEIKSENLLSEIIWDENEMSFWASMKQPKSENDINLNAEVNFNSDHTKIHMLPAEFNLFKKSWSWDDNNEIRFIDGNTRFSNFGLSNGIQKIEANGTYGLGNSTGVRIDINDLDLNNFVSFIPVKIEGNLDGDIRIKKGINEEFISGKLTARALKLQDFLTGNLFLSAAWNNNNEALNLEMNLVRNDNKKIDVLGIYYPFDNQNQLDLIAHFHDADLEVLAPFVQQNFSNVSGNLSGNVDIKGSIIAPKMKGDLSITDGHTIVNYLNTSYDLEGKIQLSNNTFHTDGLILNDTDGNLAKLTGDVSIEGSNTIALNLDADFTNFKILNTNSVDNNLYYGTAYATGHVLIRGDNHELQLNAKAKSTKGTKLFFPINQSNNIKTDQKEYIQFTNLSKKSVSHVDSLNKVIQAVAKIKGIRLDFDIELTRDAYIEMIFDIKSGDIIRGRGNGNLNLLINTDGDFSMLGDYSIESGGYNFTLYNIINKEFQINEGSTVAWYGDPYGAILNISAYYKQLTSVLPILTNLTEEQQGAIEFRKKYPTKVDLRLTKNLLSPDIKFDISIEDYPRQIAANGSSAQPYDLDTRINAFKTKIQSNEQEMNRQVFSLLILRKFTSSEDNFEINSATLENSLSEFVSNQLSYWVNQMDENLEIDVDLSGLDQDALNAFQLRMSYTFMDGRLKVTRGGGIPNDQNNENIYSYIGDWSVEYLLTEDGRFRARIYSRADLNATAINPDGNPNSIETGFSIQYVRSFNELNELIKKRKDNIPSAPVEESVDK